MSTLSQQRVEKPEAGTCVAFDDSGYRRNINGSDGYNDDSQISQDKEIHEREKDVRPIQAGRIVRERVKVGLWFDRGVTVRVCLGPGGRDKKSAIVLSSSSRCKREGFRRVRREG